MATQPAALLAVLATVLAEWGRLPHARRLVTLLVVAITPVVPPLREREKTAQPKEDGRRHARKRI